MRARFDDSFDSPRMVIATASTGLRRPRPSRAVFEGGRLTGDFGGSAPDYRSSQPLFRELDQVVDLQ